MVRRRRFFVVVLFDLLVVAAVVASLARKVRRRMFDIVGAEERQTDGQTERESEREGEREKSLPPAVPFAELERPFPPPAPPRLANPAAMPLRVCLRAHIVDRRVPIRGGEESDRAPRIADRRESLARNSTPSPGNRVRTAAFTGVRTRRSASRRFSARETFVTACALPRLPPPSEENSNAVAAVEKITSLGTFLKRKMKTRKSLKKLAEFRITDSDCE